MEGALQEQVSQEAGNRGYQGSEGLCLGLDQHHFNHILLGKVVPGPPGFQGLQKEPMGWENCYSAFRNTQSTQYGAIE